MSFYSTLAFFQSCNVKIHFVEWPKLFPLELLLCQIWKMNAKKMKNRSSQNEKMHVKYFIAVADSLGGVCVWFAHT